ncbi:MAG TPA: cytochrome c biogenesis protein ResB, partial [Nitriliruptorales bacterium]|nr:cytochrome c biogenesis protein ResB [Nitriliruptorales bacterium]
AALGASGYAATAAAARRAPRRGRAAAAHRADADADASAPTRSDAREGVVVAPADSDPGAAGEPVPRQVAAERGHLAREGGSLVFHTAFYVLLLGVVIGQLASFRGQVGVVEGHAFADTPVAYWTTDAGRWWGAEDHPGFVLALDRFTVDWTADGQPVIFRADVTLQHPDGRTEQRTTVVNDPLVVDGMKVHTLDWGYAARVVVHDRDGNVAHDAFITMTATDRGFWRGAVKAPATDPQLGLQLQLIPDAPRGDDGELQPTAWPGARAPLLLINAWRGDLRLDRVQGVNDLDTTAMQEVGAAALRPGFEVELPGGDRVAFAEMRHWVGFQVSRRPTDPLLLVAAGLLLAGLLPALYAYRRRVWVRAATEGDRTVVTVSGHAFQRPHAFDDEFASVVRTLHNRLADRPAAGGDTDPHGHAPEPPREVVRG